MSQEPERSHEQTGEQICLMCQERPAVELRELGPLAKYKLFCSMLCAATYGVYHALRMQLPRRRR